MQKSNKGIVLLITILIMLVIGLGGFIVYDKLLSNPVEPNIDNNNKEETNKDEQNKEPNVDKDEQNRGEDEIDDFAKSLIYPMDNFVMHGETREYRWNYRNINVEQLGRNNMMRTAALSLGNVTTDYEICKDLYRGEDCSVYSAREIEKEFRKIFGPDVAYTNGDLADDDNVYCDPAVIEEYDEVRKNYVGIGGCGGTSTVVYHYITKKYKSEKNSDYIYVYEYVQYIRINEEFGIVELADNEGNFDFVMIKDYDNYKNEIYEQMDQGFVPTYKWTFKKQSDGKYYFYSGNWEN